LQVEQSREAEGNETQILKRSAAEFVSRIIPHKQGYDAPQCAAESVSKAYFAVYTRGLIIIDLDNIEPV
jgi:hypothetical protein